MLLMLRALEKQVKVEGSDFAEWYRVTRGIDITDEKKKTWLLDVFGNLVLKRSPCFVRVETWPQKDVDFNTFMSELTALACVYR